MARINEISDSKTPLIHQQHLIEENNDRENIISKSNQVLRSSLKGSRKKYGIYFFFFFCKI